MSSVLRLPTPGRPTNAVPLARLFASTQALGLERWLAPESRALASSRSSAGPFTSRRWSPHRHSSGACPGRAASCASSPEIQLWNLRLAHHAGGRRGSESGGRARAGPRPPCRASSSAGAGAADAGRWPRERRGHLRALIALRGRHAARTPRAGSRVATAGQEYDSVSGSRGLPAIWQVGRHVARPHRRCSRSSGARRRSREYLPGNRH
jgi:hypothetical protein